MDTRELTTLVRKSQKGDMAAMEELISVSYSHVSYQCRSFLKTGQDAEDMTQEVLLLLYTKLDTLKEPAAYWGWIGRLTANRCKNALTRTRTDLPILEDEEGNSILDVMENEDRQTVPEEAFDNAETARMIGGIVDALPDSQRQCVILYYYDEMSVKEIAGLLGLSENTVKSRLNYARKAIRENVLDYEKKQGIRLHSLAPVPLLLYFLRMDAEAHTDKAAARRMTEKVMEKGASAMGNAAGVQTVSSGSAATQAASRALSGISVKTAAVAAAGLLIIGGVTAGVITAVNRNKDEAIETAAPVETGEQAEEMAVAAETAEPETGAEEMAEDLAKPPEEPLFPAKDIASLPYTGDVSQCAMTAAQAEAFAAVLEGCLQEIRDDRFLQEAFAGDLDRGFISMEEIKSRYHTFCKAALFDAGDGIPALWVTEAVEDNMADGLVWYSSFKVCCWDGAQAVPVIDSRETGEGVTARNCNLTGQGLLAGYSGAADSVMYDYSELYGYAGGMVEKEPLHVLEYFTADGSLAGKTDAVQAYLSGHGYAGVDHAMDTLTEDKWEGDASGLSTMVHTAAVDGKFVLADSAFGKAADHVFWSYAGDGCVLGQGEHLYTGTERFYWTGNWMDAEELAALLRSGGNAGETERPADMAEAIAENASAAAEALPENAAVSMDGNIQRTTLDPKGYDIEIYYEIPVFEETTDGYKAINAAFRELRDSFVNSGEAGPDGIWEIVEPNPPVSEHYYYTVSAEVMEQTDRYVSIRQTLDMYLGGIGGSETMYYNYRADTGEGLLLTDVLDGTEERIKRMTAVALEDTEPSAKDAGASEMVLAREISDFDFYIEDGAVHVCFDPYDVYGMAYGPGIPIDVKLPVGLKGE